ncbi:MAG: GNAT family N-acetyltransferase, partial [Nocardioidaceae bacterium]
IFSREMGVPVLGVRADVDRRIREGRLHVWDDGGRVCMVGTAWPVEGVARIGPVYTPPAYRGRGYASNLTAHVTGQVLSSGLVPTLFTDLANPTSNKIYQAIGYRGVADAFMLRFIAAEGAAVA